MKKLLLVCFLSSLTIISWSQKKPKNIIQKTQLAEVQIHSPKPIDPQLIQDQDSMTWNDYKPIPGKNWADPTLVPVRKFKMALVAVDFPDQPFVITLPKKSDLFGNPQIYPVKRDSVAKFYANFFLRPSVVNHEHTINGYWMEQSHGKFGITTLDAFGPYLIQKSLGIWAE